MREFDVEVSTAELIALEATLRALGTPEARSAVSKATRPASELSYDERNAVLDALRILNRPPHATQPGSALARLEANLEAEQSKAAPPSNKR